MSTPILERLKKMMDHEKSARVIGSIAEAEAFAKKIQELLNDHKLSMDEVEYASREKDEPVDWECVDPSKITGHKNKKKSRVGWQRRLADAIAEANGCELVYAGDTSRFFFVGRTSDRQVAKMFCEYLFQLAVEMANKSALQNMNEQRQDFTEENGYYDARKFTEFMKDYRRAWYEGFSVSVALRIEVEAARMKKDGAGSMAMVHIEKDKIAVQEFLEGKTQPATAGISGHGANVSGFMRGKAAGESIALTHNRLGGKIRGLLGAAA